MHVVPRVMVIPGVVIMLLTDDDLALKGELGEVVHQQVKPQPPTPGAWHGQALGNIYSGPRHGRPEPIGLDPGFG